MKLTPAMPQQNFTAKVKNNDFMQSYVKNSSKNRLDNLKESIIALNKVFPQDTLEINANKKGGFDIKNEAKNTSVSFKPERTLTYMMDYPIEQTLPLSLPKLLKNIATKGTEEYNKVFNTNEKPETKAEQPQNANRKSTPQEQNEVLDMLA